MACARVRVQRLAERLAHGLNIRYEHTVQKIEYGSKGVKCTCSNGETFEAGSVIVSVSLGVLKVRRSNFITPNHTSSHSITCGSKRCSLMLLGIA